MPCLEKYCLSLCTWFLLSYRYVWFCSCDELRDVALDNFLGSF
uniref:Uncharacterized protein n=1 Tax=Phakopsora pachyrhizi TaxID=170000 RepID=A0A0S1MKL5_PHAPC